MKSKTSFFNKTIFLKNVTLYWPIWGIYTFILMCVMPILLWLEYNDGYRYTPLTTEQKFNYLTNVLELMPFYTILISCTAVITGMALFSYLYNSKSANMIHSLPVDRTELFGTNVISGLTFLAVPQVVVFVITVMLCLSEGVTQVEYLGVWLLVVLATDVIAFSVVTFCAMFTGLIIALPIYVVVVNCLAYVINFLLEMVVGCFGYGINYTNLFSETILEWLSPIVCYLDKVHMHTSYNNGYTNKMELEGIHCIVIYLIMAVVLYIAAYCVYQKRKIEQAGELITVGFVKPIFRWGVGTIAAFYGSILLRELLKEFGISINLFVFVVMLLLIGMVAYFIADMFVRKTFRVFKKQNWIGCGIFSAILLVSFGAMYGYSEMAERRLPENEEIKCAFIDLSYSTKYEGEDVAVVTDIHEMILENLSYYEELDETHQYWYSDYDYEYISIYYVLKDGEVFSRSYTIPMVGEGQEIIDRIGAIEKEPKNFLKNTICNNYEAVTEFEDGWMDFEYYVDEGGELDYTSAYLTKTQMEIMYDAIVKEALEGNLMKYNTYYTSDDTEYYGKYTYHISISYVVPDGETSFDYWDYYYAHMHPEYQVAEEVKQTLNIYYGKDCQYILDAIYECGIIDKSQRLYWGEEGAWYEEPSEYFIQNAFGCDGVWMIEQFEVGGLNFARYEINEDGTKEYSNDYLVLTSEQCRELAYAAEKDATIQTLLKYNPSYINWGETYEGDDSVFLLSLDYLNPVTGEYSFAEFRFSRDCETIIYTLESLEIVESVEDICWDSYFSY